MKVITGKCRASYVRVFEPKASMNGGEEKYSITLLIPKSDTKTLTEIKNAINQIKQEEAQGKFKGINPNYIKTPVHDGDKPKQNGSEYGEECKGCYVINASSKRKPEVIDLNRDYILNTNEFYSGCYCRASINLFAYDNSGNKGIGVGLNNLQKLADGESLGGTIASAADDFGDSTPADAPWEESDDGMFN